MDHDELAKKALPSLLDATSACDVPLIRGIPDEDTGSFHFYMIKNRLKVVHAEKGKTKPTVLAFSSSPKRIIDAMENVKHGCEVGKMNGLHEMRCTKLGGTVTDDACRLPDSKLEMVARMDLVFPAPGAPEDVYGYLSQSIAYVPVASSSMSRKKSIAIEVDRDTVERWFTMVDEKPIVMLPAGASEIQQGLVDSVAMETVISRNPVDHDTDVIVTLYRKFDPDNPNHGGEIVEEFDPAGSTYMDAIRWSIRPRKKLEIDAAKNYVKEGKEFVKFMDEARDDAEKRTLLDHYNFQSHDADAMVSFVKNEIEKKEDYLLEKGVWDVN